MATKTRPVYSPDGLSKKCTLCGEFKVLTEFPPNKLTKDGLLNQCKVCKRQYQNNWRKAHPTYAANYDRVNKYDHYPSCCYVR